MGAVTILNGIGLIADVAGLASFVKDLKSGQEQENFCKFIKKTAIKACEEYSKIVNPQNKDIGFDDKSAKEHGKSIADGILASLRGEGNFTHEMILKGNENISDDNRKDLYDRIVGRLRCSFKYVELMGHADTSERLKRLEETIDIQYEGVLIILDNIDGKIDKLIALFLEYIIPQKRFPKIVTISSAPTPSDYFTGRETELTDIKNHIADNKKLMLVNGMGGIGKSEICKKLFHELDLPHVGWVVFDGDLQKTLHGKFTAVNEPDFDENVRKTVTHINGLGKDLLLFIDNMNEPSEADWDIVQSLACNVLITSRLTNVDRIKPYTIGKLSEEQCVSLYKDIRGGAVYNDEIIKELVKKSDYLTIVVELLAKTAKTANLSDETLLQKLKSKGFNLPEIKKSVNINNQARKFNEHLSLLFDISKLDEDERMVLKHFSLFPQIPLPFDYAERWFEQENPDILNKLAEKGWLFKTTQGFYMHHVISDVVRFENMPTYDDCANLVYNLCDDLRIGNKVFTTLLGILPFGESVAGWIEGDENSQSKNNFAVLLCNIASLYDEQGKYDTALYYCKKGLVITITVHGINHPNTATTYSNIGLVYKNQGDFVQALEYSLKAYKIRRVKLPDHPYTLSTYGNLKDAYQEIHPESGFDGWLAAKLGGFTEKG